MSDELILVVNSGSSSLKFGLYVERDGVEQAVLDGSADGIRSGTGKLEVKDAEGKLLGSKAANFASQREALAQAIQWLGEFSRHAPCAVGHRVVHGGPHLVIHQVITPSVIETLKASVHFAPLHIPPALELIAGITDAYPELPQFACFDTAFHQSMPESTARLALPRELFDEGIRRYGFHGLSYESIVHQLGESLPSRTVVAHLGSGASLAALKDGLSMDTTMGLTPTGGIPMATRCGDLDPGVLLYLMRVKGMNADSLEQMLNHDGGLKALSGGKSDMRDLDTAADANDQAAQLAVDVFCKSICKAIAAYAAVLGGLDMLVFTGGIGEHSAAIRNRVCVALEFLGVSLDNAANQSNAGQISTSQSKVAVRVVPSQEDRQIARHCRALLRREGDSS